MQKSPSKPVDLRDGTVIGRHGVYLLMEVRDERGRKALRYIRPS